MQQLIRVYTVCFTEVSVRNKRKLDTPLIGNGLVCCQFPRIEGSAIIPIKGLVNAFSSGFDEQLWFSQCANFTILGNDHVTPSDS